MKRRGFTLVELISVITLIGIISVLVTATVINQIKKSEYKIDEVTERLIYSASDLYLETREKDYLKINNNIYCIKLKNLVEDKKLESPVIDSNGDEISLNKYIRVFVKKNQYKYKFVDTCSRKEIYKDTVLHGADPEIGEGMIPVTISNDGVAIVADIYNKTNLWYDYGNKKWANVVTVKSDKRTKYINNDGTYKSGITVIEEDILTYLTWVPRYRYKLWNVNNHATTGADESKRHSIDIVFENKNVSKLNGTANGSYLTHPAFTFGNDEINGMWVGKFETGYNGTTKDYNVVEPEKVVIKPNMTNSTMSAWRNINVSNAFYTVLGMNENNNVFGFDFNSNDTHMMKNTEWGAVAYLSHSKYGINYEVRLNNSSSYKNGCGASEENKASSLTCENQYGTVGEYPQSTTGNITGVFDMSGGAWEYVMGVVADQSGNMYSGRNDNYNSGFVGKLGNSKDGTNTAKDEVVKATEGLESNQIGGGKDVPDSKYYDLYSYNTSAAGWSKSILGDATGELGPFNSSVSYTSSWYGDNAYFITSGNPWFLRGGGNYVTNYSGIFYFHYNKGNAFGAYSFRVVVTSK